MPAEPGVGTVAVLHARFAVVIEDGTTVRVRYTDVYVWDGAVQHDTEVTLLVKTTAAAVAALTARIVALHPYKLPEVVAVPVAADEGHAPYLAWVAAQVRRS